MREVVREQKKREGEMARSFEPQGASIQEDHAQSSESPKNSSSPGEDM
jgi:hypothetical protein